MLLNPKRTIAPSAEDPKHRPALLLTGVLAVCAMALAPTPLLAQAKASNEFAANLKFLASDDLKGRGNYQPEIDLASEFIADQFLRLGLEPAGEPGSFFQNFELPVLATPGIENVLTLRSLRRTSLVAGLTDYDLISYGDEGRIAGGLVFAGYGITAPELKYDDYRGIDAEGKIVLLLDHEPQEGIFHSDFKGTRSTPYSSLFYKIANAREHGAAAVVVLPDTLHHPYAQEEQLAPLPVQRMGIPALRMSAHWTRRFFDEAGIEFLQVQRWIESRARPFSFSFVGWEATLLLEVRETVRLGRNVVGFLPGISQELLIIGAHYDHIGTGDPEDPGEIHNGADDNASGTAALLQLARILANGPPLNRGVLFIAFAGEELGLLGSRHYVENPTVDSGLIVSMLNMDMIGRSLGELLVVGVGTAEEFAQVLDSVQASSFLEMKYALTPRAPSDHLPFSESGIPVLFFSTGLHDEYHRPDDDWDRINFPETLEIVNVIAAVALGIDRLEQRPTFVDLRGNPESLPPATDQRPVFGMQPDLNWALEGVRFQQVIDGTPASEAGLAKGDLMIGFDGLRVDNFYDFVQALSDKAPGDEVEVLVLREGQLLFQTVRLGSSLFN